MASDPAEFDAWVALRLADSNATATRPPAPPTDSLVAPVPEDELVALGRQLFATKACVGSHALGSFGAPTALSGSNLSGIGTRKMIASGSVVNSDENLAHWIQDPSRFKTGTKMVVPPITDAEARALVAFLRTRQ